MPSSPVTTRRSLIAGLGGALVLAAQAQAAEKRGAAMNNGVFAYIGCRTTRERNARGDGIGVYRVENGGWTQVQLVGGLLNPSYLAFDRQAQFLYAAHGDASEISAFQIDPAKGTLTFLNKQSCRGKNPVHLVVDPTNRWLIVANHLTVDGYLSNIAVLPRGADGMLAPVSDLVPLKGAIGPHRVEQPFAKPHQVAYDPQTRFITVPDKGCDLVRGFTLDAAGKLNAIAAAPAVARPGAGPRHIAFRADSRFAYVVNELDSTVVSYRYDAGSGALTPFQRLSSTPDSFTGYSTGSEIAVSGRFVYVSNRGDDSIGAFASDEKSGTLKALGWWPSGGKTPRFFAFSPDGAMLYAAHEDSDTIAGFQVNAETGRLNPAGIVARTGSPTCILFRRRAA